MAITWKINGTEAGPGHGLRDVRLRYGNQIADVLSFVQDGAAFDGAALFAYGAEIVLTRQVDADPAVTWFRGRITSVPRTGSQVGEAIAYEARGGWYELEQFAFMQLFKVAVDPDNPASSLTNILRGRVVLGQDDTGAKVAMGSAISDIVSFAIISGADLQLGTVSVTATIPWDEMTDLSCAEAVQRILQFAPDAVCWFDYTVDPPAFNCQRRSALAAASLAVHTAGAPDSGSFAPIESISISPRHDLLCENVCLKYIRTHRANEAAWETVESDVAPGGTTGRERGALVRTIQLAGSVLQQTILEQKIQTTEFSPSLLGFGAGPITTGADFDSLKFFWRRHLTPLQSANVVIKSFRAGTFGPQDPDDTLNTLCIRELVSGAITDWMEEFQGVESQQVVAAAEIEVEVTDPVTSKVERVVFNGNAVMTATNASKTLYSFLADESYTEEESAPSGLATSLYNALSVLQWDGRLALIEREPSALVRVGNVLNLTGGLAAWATMSALVQQVSVDVDVGRTDIVVGPARQLGPDDLVQIYRGNRSRQPVTSYLVRTTGKTGGSSSTQRQSLSKHHPVKPGSPQLPAPGRVFTAPII